MKKDIEALHKLISRFYKEHKDMSALDMADVMKMEFAHYKASDEHYHRVPENNSLSEETKTKMKEFWYSLVHQTIDFINNNDEIKQSMTERQNILDKEWNGENVDDDKIRMIPDFGVHFGIDNLEDSLEKGKWSPSSDSYLSFSVGNECVIENY